MRKPSLLIIFLSVFIDLIGFGIVLPLLPSYSEDFGATAFMIGAIGSSYSVMQFLFAPAWGRLSDRIGRRPVLLVSNLGASISYALFAIASGMSGKTGLWLLLGSRVFAGICGANLSVASAYIADVSPPEKRSKSMGLIGMAFGLGFIFGPVLGGLSLKHFGRPGPGWVACAFCAFNFLLGCVILGESRKPTSAAAPLRPKFAQWADTLRQPTVGLLIGIYFLATFCFASFEFTFGLLAKNEFRIDMQHVSYLFAYCGVLAALLQGGGIGRLVKKIGERKLIALSLVLVAVSMAVIPFFGQMGALLLTLALFAAGSGINRPPTFGLISILTSEAEQGAVMGVAQSAGSLARIFAPLFAVQAYYVRPWLPYVICAALALLTGLFAWVKLCGPGANAAKASSRP